MFWEHNFIEVIESKRIIIKFFIVILIKANGLNMVRLAFWNASFSTYYKSYLLLSSSILALSAKCTIFFVVNSFYSIIHFINSFLSTIDQLCGCLSPFALYPLFSVGIYSTRLKPDFLRLSESRFI